MAEEGKKKAAKKPAKKKATKKKANGQKAKNDTVVEGRVSAEEAAGETADYVLQGATAIVGNEQGFLKTIKPNTIGTLMGRVDEVRELLKEYSPLEVTAVCVGTRYAGINSMTGLEGYEPKGDAVSEGSKIDMRTRDGSLECHLYVGFPDAQAEEQHMWQIGKKVLIDQGLAVSSIVAGTVLRKVGGHLGGLLAKAGGFYSVGSAVKRMVDGVSMSGYVTIELEPTGKGDITPEKEAIYRNLVDKLA